MNPTVRPAPDSNPGRHSHARKTRPPPRAVVDASGRCGASGLVCGERAGEERVVEVEQWAEIRRLHFVAWLVEAGDRARTGLAATRSLERCAATRRRPIERAPAGTKLDPFKDEIHRLLKADPKLPGQRIRELIAPLGFEGGKTIVDDYLREVRPLFAPPPRTFQRTVYRPGRDLPVRLWEPKQEIPVGHGQTRQGLGRRRVPGLLARRRWRPGLQQADPRSARRDPSLLVVAGRVAPDCWSGIVRPASTATAAAPATSSPPSAGSCRVDWQFCEPADPQAKGVVEETVRRTVCEAGATCWGQPGNRGCPVARRT